MQRGAITVVRPDLHNIADIDHQRVGSWFYKMPLAVTKHFQSRLIVLQEQGQRAGIGMVVDTKMTLL